MQKKTKIVNNDLKSFDFVPQYRMRIAFIWGI